MVARPPRLNGGGNLLLFKPRGSHRDLWSARESQLVLDGAGGTGKTRNCCERLVHLCDNVPGLRFGLFRQTRKSLNQTVLETLENHVMRPVRHPMLTARARGSRDDYYHPKTGARIILGGFDHIERLFSMELDGAWIEEGIEVSQSAAASLWRAFRHNAWGRHQLWISTNPGPWSHWINQMCTDINPEGGRARRLKSFHADNPALTLEYLENLDKNTGSGDIRDRLYLGLWVYAQGRILDGFGPWNQVTGVLEDGELDLESRDGDWYLHLPPEHPCGEVDEEGVRWVRLAWFGASIDWGPKEPASLLLWGVTEDDRHFLIEEVYEKGPRLERYSEVVCDWHERYRLRAVVADHADPDKIRMVNDRLGRMDRSAAGLVINANKSWKVGIDTFNWYMDRDEGGVPRAFFLDTSLKKADDALLAKAAEGNPVPIRLVDEIQALTWIKEEDGRPVREQQDPLCADHACDAARYWFMWAWMRKYGTRGPEDRFKKGALGQVLEHEKELRRMARLFR